MGFNMNVVEAATNCCQYIEEANLPEQHSEYGKDHLLYMVGEIQSGRVTGKKAHRWLGWLQACLCIGSAISLEELKIINAEAMQKQQEWMKNVNYRND